QAPGRPGPPPALLQVPPLQEQVLPVPCTLPATWEQPTEPLRDAVVLTEDQGHPAPTDGCPHPATAPLACSTAALDSGGESGGCGASAPGGCGCGCGKAGIAPLGMALLFQQPQRAQTSRRTPRTSRSSWHGSTTVSVGAAELAGGCWHPLGVGKKAGIAPLGGDFLPFPEVTSKTGILDDDDDNADIDDLLAWITNEETPGTDRLDSDVEMDRLLSWIDEATASALDVPQHNQDLPGVTREGTKDTASRCQTQELTQGITATEPLSPDVSSRRDSCSSITEHSDSSRASRELSKEAHRESG
ncbi:hypothetical protein CIB84_017617, partial [Bambusicola thoracicus]